NPVIFDRNAEGLIFSQLITDFGRTANLTASSRLRALAEEENVQATRAQVALQVSGAYFGALQAQALEQVGKQTLATRELLLKQVSVLASNQIKSDLDVSFAQVSVEEARLLLLRAQNDLKSANSVLATLLDER